MARWRDGRVAVEDSVRAATSPGSGVLRDRFLADIPILTLGLVQVRGNSFHIGPVEMLRFGPPRLKRNAVEWPIEGGLLTREPGGRWRLEAGGGFLKASADGYRPRLPPWIYALTQLQVHHLLTRLYLLRVRGAHPSPGTKPASRERLQAAAVDVALCATIARIAGRRRGVGWLLGITATYHLACWTIVGRTVGGAVMGQRVVATDGSRLTWTQAMLRLAAAPLSLFAGLHDEVACSEVITG